MMGGGLLPGLRPSADGSTPTASEGDSPRVYAPYRGLDLTEPAEPPSGDPRATREGPQESSEGHQGLPGCPNPEVSHRDSQRQRSESQETEDDNAFRTEAVLRPTRLSGLRPNPPLATPERSTRDQGAGRTHRPFIRSLSVRFGSQEYPLAQGQPRAAPLLKGQPAHHTGQGPGA